MARPIKVHEDTLFKVMTKSLKPIETHLSGIHKALAKQSVEDRIEGKRAEKLMRDNELRQTKLLEHIDKVLSATKPTGKTIKDSEGFKISKNKTLIAAIAAAIYAALPERYKEDPERGAGAFAGMQLWWKNMKKSWKNWKSPQSFSEAWLKFTTKWDAWITQIKESKAFTQMSETWKNFKKEFITPFTSAFTLKEGSKVQKFVTWLGSLKTGALGIGGWLLKWFRPLYYVYAIWEAASAGMDAADDLAIKDPNAGLAKKSIVIGGAVTDKLWEILVEKMIVGFAGDAVQFLFEKILPTSWTFDKDGNITVFGKQYKFGEDWNLGERMTKWRHEMMKDIGEALDKFWNNFTWNPDKWAKDLDAWFQETIIAFAKDIFNILKETVKNIIKKPGEIYDAVVNTDYKAIAERHSGLGNKKVTSTEDALEYQKRIAGAAGSDAIRKFEGQRDRTKAFVESKRVPEPGIVDSALDMADTGLNAMNRFLKKFLKSEKTDSSPKQETDSLAKLVSGTKTIRAEDAVMGGMKWDAMSPYGRKGIEYVIRKIYERHGGPEPVFTSGLRPPGHPLYSKGSKHSEGYAFDLRSKNLGDKKAAIQADLLAAFKGDGWFSQFEPMRHFNPRTGTKATGEHFHFQKAAQGFFGTVKQPTVFLTGEEGPEHVAIFPNNDPNNRMNKMNQLQSERAMSQGTPPITIISNDNSSNSSGSSSPWIITGAPIRKQVNV